MYGLIGAQKTEENTVLERRMYEGLEKPKNIDLITARGERALKKHILDSSFARRNSKRFLTLFGRTPEYLSEYGMEFLRGLKEFSCQGRLAATLEAVIPTYSNSFIGDELTLLYEEVMQDNPCMGCIFKQRLELQKR